MFKAQPVEYIWDFETNPPPVSENGPYRRIVLSFMPWTHGNMMKVKIQQKSGFSWKDIYTAFFYDNDNPSKKISLQVLASQDIRGSHAENMAALTFMDICGEFILSQYAPNYWKKHQILLQSKR